ncbi:MAG: hypothetical protein R3E96_06215 [Planctomycetota bacterium]
MRRTSLILLATLTAASAFALPSFLRPVAPEALPQLDPQHPAVLSGRTTRQQLGYVDLHAPLSPAEAARLAPYRGPAVPQTQAAE